MSDGAVKERAAGVRTATAVEAVCLAFNENPAPVEAAVVAAITAAASRVNRYPFEDEPRVMRRLAEHFDCPEANLMLVRGIDECFDRLCEAFPGMRQVSAWPDFDGYRGRIGVYGLPHFELGLTESLQLDPADLARLTREDFVTLASPSNPTSLLLGEDELAALRARAGKLLIDETYVDYSTRRRQRPAFGEHEYVFRSFSKSYGLAGLRLGVLFGPAEAIASMKRRQWFSNVGTLELNALEAVLDHDQARDAHVASILAERARVSEALRALGYRVVPSEANFVLVANPAGARTLAWLAGQGVQVKDAAQFGLAGHLRISIGLAHENDRLLAALGSFPEAAGFSESVSIQGEFHD